MTYGELKDFVLQLLNEYSVAGAKTPLSYSNKADLAARIPALTRDGLYYVATTARRLRAVADLTRPQTVGDTLIYDLPDDFYQMAGGLLRLDGEHAGRFGGCRLVAGRQVLIPKSEAGRYQVEYFRYPSVPADVPEDDDFLDCPPEAQTAVAYYVAAHLAMEDNNYLHGALYNEFEMKMLRLQEGAFLECGVTEDVYA